MNYSGPQILDFSEVQTLNLATLELLRAEQQGDSFRQGLSHRLGPLVLALTDLQIRRLAAAPFLLLSLREQDEDYWQQLLTDDPRRDLFAPCRRTSGDSQRLQSAAIGFVWQLARRNPYAARLVCGASLAWCEQLAELSLFELLRSTADRDDLLQLRFADNEHFWIRLLGPGLSSDTSIRRAAHLCALQTTLAEAVEAQGQRLSAAACTAPVPTLTATRSVNPL